MDGLTALFTVNLSHLHYNIFERAGCDEKCKIARDCLTSISTFKNIVIQMRKGNREKGIVYIEGFTFTEKVLQVQA